jgi:signal transduction histidine kinase
MKDRADFIVDVPQLLPSVLELALFRILQENLLNAVVR